MPRRYSIIPKRRSKYLAFWMNLSTEGFFGSGRLGKPYGLLNFKVKFLSRQMLHIQLLTSHNKASQKYAPAEEDYLQRIQHYCRFERLSIPKTKSKQTKPEDHLKHETQAYKKLIAQDHFIALLDEGGESFSSLKFSRWMQHLAVRGKSKITFLIGGAYGFSKEMHGVADAKISLSPLTFSHQIVPLIFLEQLYRAFTIIHGQKYHH